MLGINTIPISSLLCLLADHSKNSWKKNRRRVLGGRLGSAPGCEHTLIYRLVPVLCLAFGCDTLLMIIATLSQKSRFLLPTNNSQNHPSPWWFCFCSSRVTQKTNHEAMCVMKNCLHNSEIHKTWKQLYLISQSQLKLHPVLPTCSALLYTSAGTLTEKPSPLKSITQY